MRDPIAPPPGEAATPDAAAPSLSAAETLAAMPFFNELSAVDLARLVPDLEEYHFAPGEAVFCQGDPGDGLYLIRAGTAEVTVTEEGEAQTATVLEAPAHFGEGALLTDEPRSTSVVAATPLAVWKLPRERFTALVNDHPHFALRLAAALAERLAEMTRRVSAGKEQVTIIARVAYGGLDAPAQALLRRIAVLARFDVALLRATLGPAWSEPTFARLVEEAVFFRPSAPPGSFAFLQESVRGFLLSQLRAEVGERGLQALRRRAADAILARPDADPADALELLRAADDWPRLGRLLEERGAAVAAHDPVRVEGYLRALPPRLLWIRPPLVHLLGECCAAQGKLEQAIAAYREAERRDRAAQRPPLAVEYQRALAALYGRLGDQDSALACLRRALELEGGPGGAGDCDAAPPRSLTEAPDDEGRNGGGAGVHTRGGWGRGYGLAPLANVPWRNLSARALVAAGVLAVVVLAWFLPPPPGLSVAGLRVLVTIAALVALGFLDVLPDYLLALLMVAAWIVTGTLPPAVAAAGFASPTWFLLLASMALGAAVARSGLLYRGAIELVRRLPASHWIRCLTLAALGLLFSPGMPSPPGRLMLATPLAQDIADTLRYPARSGGAAGLALATFVGFGMMGPLFLTGSPGGLIAYGLLPPEARARMDWVSWFLAALPTHLLLFGLTIAFVLARYRPADADTLPAETLALQRRVLGRLSRDEWGVLATLGALLVGFSTQSLHGVDPAWLAVAAVVLLYLLGALDDATFGEGVNLSFLLYLGVILGFGQIFTHVELDRWLSEQLTGVTGLIGGSALRCVGVIAAIAVIAGLALRPSPIVLLLGVALYPVAASAGVQPWVVMLTIMLANNLWLYPQQNVLYQSAYYATGERAFSHAQARPLAFAYAGFVLLSLLASIPYWRWLGLIG